MFEIKVEMSENIKNIKKTDGIKSLVIVESPAKIKTISKILGQDFKIVSTSGHIKDLPEKTLGVEVKDGHIEINYVPIKGKATIISDICKEAKKVDEVLLASDHDREGELISFHIGEEIKKTVKDKAKIYRIVFNEITKPALKDAIKNKHEVDLKKVAAQQARRILDRWVGYEVSPILWRKISKGLSAGRVQSVAVMFICDREKEILSFVAEESWSITSFLKHLDFSFEATLFKIKGKSVLLKNKEAADKVLQQLEGQKFVVKSIVDKERAKNPVAPFITSSLQQEAYNKLGFSVDKTMMIAQKLYEGVSLENNSTEALITYMRTDSVRLSEVALTDIRAFVLNAYGKNYLPGKSHIYAKSSAAQDAHEAIRPVDISKTPDSVKSFLENDFYKLYDLIWKRTVACQMSAAVFAQRQILIDVLDGNFLFKATGSTLIFDGFLKLYKPEDDNEEKNLPLPKDIVEQAELFVEKIASKQHFTQPPPRFTEATLVKELKNQGIGRPSTYAAIISTIQKRSYVEKVEKRFVPTELGKAVVVMLVDNLKDIINASFTANMEGDLDKIASGEKDRDSVLLPFYEKFQKDLTSFKVNADENKPTKFVPTEEVCPKCKKNNLLIRFSKGSEFLACSGFPDCNFTSSFEREADGKLKLLEKGVAKEIDLECPQCGKRLVEKMGRFGKFAACPGYPECKYIHKSFAKKESGSKFAKKKEGITN